MSMRKLLAISPDTEKAEIPPNYEPVPWKQRRVDAPKPGKDVGNSRSCDCLSTL
jgi:hypothetical protein